MQNILLKTIYKKSPKIKIWSATLTDHGCKHRGQMKQHTATILNSLVGCAFSGSNEYAASMPCIFF